MRAKLRRVLKVPQRAGGANRTSSYRRQRTRSSVHPGPATASKRTSACPQPNQSGFGGLHFLNNLSTFPATPHPRQLLTCTPSLQPRSSRREDPKKPRGGTRLGSRPEPDHPSAGATGGMGLGPRTRQTQHWTPVPGSRTRAQKLTEGSRVKEGK